MSDYEMPEGDCEYIANWLRSLADSIENEETYGSWESNNNRGPTIPMGSNLMSIDFEAEVQTPDYKAEIDIIDKTPSKPVKPPEKEDEEPAGEMSVEFENVELTDTDFDMEMNGTTATIDLNSATAEADAVIEWENTDE